VFVRQDKLEVVQCAMFRLRSTFPTRTARDNEFRNNLDSLLDTGIAMLLRHRASGSQFMLVSCEW
jgi:hypothetical protein